MVFLSLTKDNLPSSWHMEQGLSGCQPGLFDEDRKQSFFSVDSSSLTMHLPSQRSRAVKLQKAMPMLLWHPHVSVHDAWFPRRQRLLQQTVARS